MIRRQFLSAAACTAGWFAAGCKTGHSAVRKELSIELKGKKESPVSHWDIITIGNLSRNRYWGESEEKSLHAVICTTTLIRCGKYNLVIDPSLKDSTMMADELLRRTGLSPDRIDAVFVTHEHGDHHCGMPNFPRARWLASGLTAEAINRNEQYAKKVEAAGRTIFDVIDVVDAPGHTPGTAGVRFDYRGLSVFVAGDAVATKDFWDEGRMYFKALDIEQSKKTMQKIAAISNIVVPGHDNYFLCR